MEVQTKNGEQFMIKRKKHTNLEICTMKLSISMECYLKFQTKIIVYKQNNGENQKFKLRNV
ncbi:hypothetical protein ERICIV_00425 [Paenibacillus larvae subsp. larvae]|uniref:Uncharacterized protein n=1 Tax=Paenibacillus larvae subsp. larvae TaxID=147375 RepID=A0A2L1U919_9BACL|nr:hypothetical protein B1222_14545 [Paenibacillus larvae subsp. pulvifaciens]AVF24661.1 hypothetical protein ERICIII_00425 [Paenibacillus larvae subsp. larvae]AVF29422.1 hypothetical protein ERICIV_00425 [Paenibacillus larvae subsp. larvae]